MTKFTEKDQIYGKVTNSDIDLSNKKVIKKAHWYPCHLPKFSFHKHQG